jgi:hypothetical protein
MLATPGKHPQRSDFESLPVCLTPFQRSIPYFLIACILAECRCKHVLETKALACRKILIFRMFACWATSSLSVQQAGRLDTPDHQIMQLGLAGRLDGRGSSQFRGCLGDDGLLRMVRISQHTQSRHLFATEELSD